MLKKFYPERTCTERSRSSRRTGFTTFMKTERGFTLIELLVVISIIAILSTIGLLTYSSVLEQGRDSKRQADLRLIQSALEQYHADQKFYPKQFTSFRNCEDGLNGYLHMILNTECPLKDSTGNKTYLNKVPKDPRSAGFYKYAALSSGSDACNNTTVLCTSYCLFAKMEDSTNTTSIPTQCSSSLPAGFNYVVTPP